MDVSVADVKQMAGTKNRVHVHRQKTSEDMYGYRQVKDLFIKNKWTLLVSVWSTAILCLHLHFASKWTVDTDVLNKPLMMAAQQNMNISLNLHQSRPQERIKYYDVLLSGYMRSGSTLTGMILGWRDDSFYLYEPLWKISRWTYWHGNDSVCRSDRLSCRKVEPGKAVDDLSFPENINRLPGGSLVMAMKILRKIYDCQFNDFERTVLYPMPTVHLGGPSWNQVAECISGKGNQKLCMHRYAPRKCKNATHRVSKVLRLSTDLYSGILRERKNLKVIHLFRDPRAIMNSRIKTPWYPSQTPEAIIENAKGLCKKMLDDFREGKKVLSLYPDRFRFIYYEDLNENLLNKTKILYRYLGMDLNERYYPEVIKMSAFSNATDQTSREKNTAFWWRRTLPWDIVQKMEPVCSEVYKQLGYKSLSSIEQYRDLTFKSVDIPKEYLIN